MLLSVMPFVFLWFNIIFVYISNQKNQYDHLIFILFNTVSIFLERI